MAITNYKYRCTGQVLEPEGYVYNGDSRDVLPALHGAGFSCPFIFADPPFGIGVQYGGDFDDNMTPAEYHAFTADWITKAAKILDICGRLYVHVPDACVHPVLDAAESCGLVRKEWLIWHYRFGQCGKTKYINSKCHGLVFARHNHGTLTWNPDAVAVASDRASTYQDPRTLESQTPGKRVPLDVWGIPSDGPFWGRVPGNSKERRGHHPNQLPEVYLARIIKGYTNLGDYVLDPFGGSGTSAVVAHTLGRRFLTIEQSPEFAQSILDRVNAGAVRV